MNYTIRSCICGKVSSYQGYRLSLDTIWSPIVLFRKGNLNRCYIMVIYFGVNRSPIPHLSMTKSVA